MMTRRGILLLALLAVFVLATVAGRRWLAPPPHQINRESYEQIRAGMTLAEVEALLGVPPGEYHGSQTGIPHPIPTGDKGPDYQCWTSDAGLILVWCEEAPHARVVTKKFCDVAHREWTTRDILRMWLRW